LGRSPEGMDQADGMIVAPGGGVGEPESWIGKARRCGCYDAAQGIACSRDTIDYRVVRGFARR
jgi:hypothetical protein